jgi:signal transduction histidine kinase/DNA-binding NarL/FixJ family response regulator
MSGQPRQALLALAKSLAQSRQGGVLADALELTLAGVPGTRGAVWHVASDRLVLLADRGMTADLRRALSQLPLCEPFWFAAQRAARARKPVVEGDVAASAGTRLDAATVAKASWSAVAALPIVAGREVLGVLCVAARDVGQLQGDALTYLETAAHVIALALAGAATDEDRRDPGRVVKTAQMAALGLLAAGVADELRGPLGALAISIKTQERVVAQLRSRAVAGDREVSELDELTQEARAAIHRAREITARLLSAVQESTPERIDLGEVARSALGRLEPYLNARSVVIEAAIAGGSYVSGRREELSQIVVNLLINAADACEDTDRARGAHERMGRRMRLSVAVDGTRVALAVEDSGPGVPANLRPRIFDAFFTTKGDAIGIGLTLARQAVVAHGGHIELAPSGLGGALFRVLLPADLSTYPAPHEQITPPAAPLTPPPAPRAPHQRRPRIAWIDDDEMFLRSMRRVLEDWDICSAQTAGEGERLLEQESVELVFCDVGLPDGSGHLVHAAVKARNPALASRFVFVTGGVITPEVADYLIASGCPTLLKPVNAEEIRAMLEGEEAGDATPTSARTLRDAASSPPARVFEEAALATHGSDKPPARRTDDTVPQRRRRDS